MRRSIVVDALLSCVDDGVGFVAETVVVVVTDVVVAETVVGLPEQIHHLQVQPVGAAVVAVIGVKLTPINI